VANGNAAEGRLIVLAYIRIARPDHWFKNVFVLPGTAVALLLGGGKFQDIWGDLLLVLLVTSLAASANYTLNELLDAESDKHHPSKRQRPIPMGLVSVPLAVLQYIILAFVSLAMAYLLGNFILSTIAVFLVLGLAYNVPPIRTKDRVYLDVISESANNAVRLVLGWAVVIPDAFPPSSIVLAFWLGGAYLMAVKRYAEVRQIGDPAVAARYRESFGRYTEEKLLLSALFYAMNTAFFIAVFLLKYRIEFVVSFPMIALMFAWYLAIGMQPESIAQTPEHLYRQKGFLALIGSIVMLFAVLLLVDIPLLHVLLEPIGR
jgi:decaprenyl-phosphate phosphoribosyltransferase